MAEREVRRVAVARVLPTKDLAVPRHWARVHQQEVEAPAGPFANAGVAHGRHHNADVEVPAAKGNVGELVGVPAGQHHVVHENEDLPFHPLLSEGRLLVQQLVHQGLVPLRKEHSFVPPGVPLHHGLQAGRTRCASHEGHYQVKPFVHLKHEVGNGCRLPAPSCPHRRQHYRHPVEHPLGVPPF